jgi:erythritol transport system ATP-binding protein
VMSNGRLVMVVDRKDATEEMIISASAEGHKTKRMHA